MLPNQREEKNKEPMTKLFVKASGGDESMGHCPMFQRLFRILWLKGVVFSVTTIVLKRKPADLLNMLPGHTYHL
ncbi:hypothetical protein HPG69_005635 [Diceros bicornis minor]|uniref:CLIC N-terminal domain-containing protein n=1 Tax=Diceros bicornis minor TaxID=77932 RepID=A0A7J7ENN8_DICBM|nr:hypothetical protein HPG69_005635 [Diceros bicornis minor]